MSSIAELLGDEISDFTKHVKPEEEIMKYSTSDDLGEVKRAVHLLKKGYQSQKITIIENLHVSVHEPQSNEELLPIILSSMEIWDMNMQKECAKSFQKEETLKAMNTANQVKLMDELLNIIMNVDITQEEFIEEWLKVFKALCPFLPIEYLRYTVIKRIADLPSLKQTLPWRRVGFSMFWSLIMAKGEELLKDEPLAMKMVHSMCGDNNWRIRKEAARYMAEFLKELHKLKPVQTVKGNNSIIGKNQFIRRQLSLFGTFSPHSADMDEDSFSFTDATNAALNLSPGGPLPENCKLSRQRFRDDFYELLADLTADTELLVRQEGIEMFIDLLPFVTKADLEQDFLPQLKETLEDMTKDDLADDDAEIRMINNLGNIADKLAKCGYLKPTFSDEYRLDKIFLEYFKACMNHQVQGVRRGAAYNLPCFYLYFRFWEPNLESSFNEFDDSRVFLDKYYFDLCSDPNTPLDILVTLASGFHEILQMFPQDQKLPTHILESLKILLNSEHWPVKEVLVKHIDKIIKAYWRREEQTLIVEEVRNFYDEAIKKGPEMFKARRQQNMLLNNLQQQSDNNKGSITEPDSSSSNPQSSQQTQKAMGSPKRKGKKGGGSDALISAGTTIGFSGYIQPKSEIAQSKLEGIYAVYLQTIIDIEVCPEEFHHEYLYSRLLENMMPFIVSIISDKTKWRMQETFITNLGDCVGCFNPQELQELILPHIIEKIKVQNDQVKQACCWFIANLIANQYKQKKRKGLIDMMINDYGKSKTFSLRKTFIMFCSSAIRVLSYQTFKQHFFDLYLSLAADPVPNVRIAFLNSVCSIRPYLELDSAALNLFNVALSSFLMDTSQTVFELTSQVDLKLLKLKRQPMFGATKQEETNRINAELKLKERDQNEEEAKQKAGDSTKNKLEFLTTALQLQTMLGRRPGGGIGVGGALGAPIKKLPGLSKTSKKSNKELNPLKGNISTQQSATFGKTDKGPQINSSINGQLPKSNEQQNQQSTQQQTGNAIMQQNGGLTTVSDKNGSLIQKFRKRVKKENNSILPPILGGPQIGPQSSSNTGNSSLIGSSSQSSQNLTQNSQTNSTNQLKTIRKVDINISSLTQKDNKLAETPPITSVTPSTGGGKESLLIPSNKMSDKRLSFKEGSTIEEVVRTYQSTHGGGGGSSTGHRRSLVPRHSVSMSPLKKEQQLNEIKEIVGSNTEVKASQNDDQRGAPMTQLPLNLINQGGSSSGGGGGSIPHEVKQILWKNSIMTKIKEQINSQLNQFSGSLSNAQTQQQSVTPHHTSQPSLLSSNGPPTINSAAISSIGFQQLSLTPHAQSLHSKEIEQNNFVNQNKPGTSNIIFSKRRISSEDLDSLGRKINNSEDIPNENQSTNPSEPIFSQTGPLPRATNNALIPRQSRVMRPPAQFSSSPGPSTSSQFQLNPSGVVYNQNSGGSPAPISKNVMPMRPPYFMQQKEISLQQQQQNAAAGSSNHLLPPLAQYLKNKHNLSRAAAQHQYTHQNSQHHHHQMGKASENNSDILVVKLHGVAEVMNETKNQAAKRAQSSGGTDQASAQNARSKIHHHDPLPAGDNQTIKRPDSYQNKMRGQAAIVQQQIQQTTLGVPAQLANTRNAVQAKAVKSYSELSHSGMSTMLNSDSRQQNNYTIATSGQGSSQQMWNSHERKGISSSGHHSSTGTLGAGSHGGGILAPVSGGSRLISPKTQLGGTAHFGNIVHIKERKV